VSPPHAANTDNGFGQFVARRQKTASQYLSWDNSESSYGDCRRFQESAPALSKIIHVIFILLFILNSIIPLYKDIKENNGINRY
jgi:hypothetical protein